MLVVDDVGVTVGVLASVSFTSSNARQVVRRNGEHVVALRVAPTGFAEAPFRFNYESADCSGTPLMDATDNLVPQVVYPRDDRTVGFYATGTAVIRLLLSQKAFGTTASSCSGLATTTIFNPSDNTCCIAYGASAFTTDEISTIDLSGFVPPFHIEGR